MCGLQSKLDIGILDLHLQAYDIICLLETKTDTPELSHSHLCDFQCYSMPKYSNKQKFGGFHGMCVLMKNHVFNCSERIHATVSESILWVKIDSRILGFEFIVGAVYLPCEGTIHHSDEVFDNLVQDIIDIKGRYDAPFCLLGDFNARTGLLNDFLDVEDVLTNHTGLGFCNDVSDMYAAVDGLGILTSRYNTDVHVNNNGKSVIDMCQSFDLRIINGRKGGDQSVGKYTCFNKNGGCSTIDYVIVSHQLFSCITHFSIDVFDKCLSDVHCPVSMTLQSKNSKSVDVGLVCDISQNTAESNSNSELQSTESQHYLKFRWDSNSAVLFKQKIRDSTEELCKNMVCLERNANQDSIDSYYSQLCDMFVNVAQDVGICEWRRPGSYVNTNETKDKNNQQPWFDTECRAARREYLNIKNSLKRKLKFLGASEANCLLNNFKSAGRLYKNLLRHKRRKYYRDLNESLRSLQASNPKEYWQLLNNNNERKRKKIGNVSLGDFVNHFSRLGNGQDDQSTGPGDNISEFSEADGALNAPVTFQEVELMIRKLKNSKACGKDFIRNEFLKNCPIEMLHVLVKFFNVVLDSGIVPTEWCIGIIIPIFKNKGMDTNPDNYRGITLLSCLGKLFTSILNHRISLLFEAANMLGEEQAGFRSNYSTTDNIFVLKSIIDIYLRNKKRLYCAFIDYKKAFDLIDRSSLWYKMLKMGLRGKLFTVIKNIYESAKSCVAVRGEMSEFFTCNTGVRQGENLSPLLFAIYLNDFQEYISNSHGGLKYLERELSDCLELEFDNANVALNLSCLLYADDTIILAETPEELQKALDAVDSYCQTWHLTVNASKTKVVIFSRGKVRRIPEFVYGGDPLEVVDDFVYLGVKFNYNGSFKKAISKQVTQARKALYSMLVKEKKYYSLWTHSAICLITLFYLFYYMAVKYGAMSV